MRAAEIAAGGWVLPEPAPHTPGEPLTVAWVTVPPSATSGGHTTMFRLIGALEDAGHTCVVYLDDRHGWDIEQHRRNVRAWLPNIRAEVRDVRAGIEDAHVIFATSWQTAYPVLASPALGRALLLRRGLRAVVLPGRQRGPPGRGHLSLRLPRGHRRRGGWPDAAPRLRHADRPLRLRLRPRDLRARPLARGRERRTGICYYCRPSTPRRAHELAIATLDLFAARHPEVDIHFYGEPPGKLPFRAIDHGFLNPKQLNELYNRCVAGLVLSATNVSLVPHEMLASGCIPVVNDAEHARIVLDNDHVAYAPPTPFELANALNALVEDRSPERVEAAARAA